MEENLLTFQNLKRGIQQVTLNVKALYPKEEGRKIFERKLLEFFNLPHSTSIHSRIFEYIGDNITYRTECIIPILSDKRPPLLLIFGNPASHSVDSEMFFASEGKEREHRIWSILSKAGILSFPSIADVCPMDERNRLRKSELYEISYCSPFRIGLAVYYTMPSPASEEPYAGVKGLRRLFGTSGLRKIGECEKGRLAQIIRAFVSPNGIVIAFQKDAYLAIKSAKSPDYAIDKARELCLIGNCQCAPSVRLFCLPPTRLSRGNMGDLLQELRERILEGV